MANQPLHELFALRPARRDRNAGRDNEKWSYQHVPTKGTRSVYVIEAGALVKIGTANDPYHRRKHMQTGSPHELRICFWAEFANEDDANAVEKAAHEELRAVRQRGEWFDTSTDFAAATVISVSREVGCAVVRAAPRGPAIVSSEEERSDFDKCLKPAPKNRPKGGFVR